MWVANGGRAQEPSTQPGGTRRRGVGLNQPKSVRASRKKLPIES